MLTKKTLYTLCYRELERKNIELGQYKRMSQEQSKDGMGKLDDKDKEIAKLQYMVRTIKPFVVVINASITIGVV